MELRCRDGRLGPKGPKFGMLEIQEALLYWFRNWASNRAKKARFLSQSLDYDGVFSQIGAVKSLPQHDLCPPCLEIGVLFIEAPT